MKKVIIIGGGTMSHVRNHLSLAAPAYGTIAKQIFDYLVDVDNVNHDYKIVLTKTKMAGGDKIETTQDLSNYVDELIKDKDVRGIFFSAAIVDFDGQIGEVASSKSAERLKTKEGNQTMTLTPTDKIIGRIRKERKDIFVVGFKTTHGANDSDQYQAGLELLKKNSLNLVVANDVVTRKNMIIVPEESYYSHTTDRKVLVENLVKIAFRRMSNTFTRSTVIPGEQVSFNDDRIPMNLREVVNHCVERGAYKPVLGKTAGHFAVKVDDSTILTTIRKTNFNDFKKDLGLVKIESTGPDTVVAHGFRPSVGGQSQRIIFSEHKDVDCIVHFHCPPKKQLNNLSTAAQWPNECGSHQCGKNTSDHLKKHELPGGFVKAVYLDQHGPNIVFNSKTPASQIIHFIEENFDLTRKTDGLGN